MARRRMFSLDVVETDRFMDMPTSAQALYFHLGLHGDDEGFVSSPKRIARSIGSCDDDLRLLASKNFIIPFDSGIIVITDWARNNTLKNDRFHATDYKAEREMLSLDECSRYCFGTNMEPAWNQLGTNLEPEHNVTEHNTTKGKEDRRVSQAKTHRERKKSTPKMFVPPSLDEVREYCKQRNSSVDAERFFDYFEASGWVDSKGNHVRNWKQKVITWEGREQNGKSGACSISAGRTDQEIVFPGITIL